MLRNKLIKTLLQSQELCLYSSHKPPVYIQPGGDRKSGMSSWMGLGFSQQSWKALVLQRKVYEHTHTFWKKCLSVPFPSTINYYTNHRKKKYNSQFHLPRSYNSVLCENAQVIYDSGISLPNTSSINFTTLKNHLFTIFFPLHLQDLFLFCSTWRILSCSLLSLEYSCHSVWVRAVKSAQKRCVPHKRYGPERGWYHSLWQCKDRRWTSYFWYSHNSVMMTTVCYLNP